MLPGVDPPEVSTDGPSPVHVLSMKVLGLPPLSGPEAPSTGLPTLEGLPFVSLGSSVVVRPRYLPPEPRLVGHFRTTFLPPSVAARNSQEPTDEYLLIGL